MNANKTATTGAKGKTFGAKIHSMLFAFAAQVHGSECITNKDLVEAIRRDIVDMNISKVPSISKLSTTQKVVLVNQYLAAVGQKRKVKLPSNYDPSRRSPRPRPGLGISGDAMPTPEQLAELHRRLDSLGYPKLGDIRERFIKKQCGFKTPPTRRLLQKVMGAVRAMEQRGWRYQHGDAEDMEREDD